MRLGDGGLAVLVPGRADLEPAVDPVGVVVLRRGVAAVGLGLRVDGYPVDGLVVVGVAAQFAPVPGGPVGARVQPPLTVVGVRVVTPVVPLLDDREVLGQQAPAATSRCLAASARFQATNCSSGLDGFISSAFQIALPGSR